MHDSDKIKQNVAKKLKAAREQAGLSQGQIAKLLGFHRPTISEIEAGRRNVTADELSFFAEKYDVTISWLTGENPEPHDPKVELAARELSKLKSEDLDSVMNLLKTLKISKDKGNER